MTKRIITPTLIVDDIPSPPMQSAIPESTYTKYMLKMAKSSDEEAKATAKDIKKRASKCGYKHFDLSEFNAKAEAENLKALKKEKKEMKAKKKKLIIDAGAAKIDRQLATAFSAQGHPLETISGMVLAYAHAKKARCGKSLYDLIATKFMTGYTINPLTSRFIAIKKAKPSRISVKEEKI